MIVSLFDLSGGKGGQESVDLLKYFVQFRKFKWRCMVLEKISKKERVKLNELVLFRFPSLRLSEGA